MERNTQLEQRAIDFFKEITNTKQLLDVNSLGIIKLMVMFTQSEIQNNNYLQSSFDDLLDSNIKLSEEIISHENKIDELNQSLDEANSGISMLEDIIKKKDLDAGNLLSYCEDINISTLKLVYDYNNLMARFKESQNLLKDFFKSDLPENLN